MFLNANTEINHPGDAASPNISTGEGLPTTPLSPFTGEGLQATTPPSPLG